MPVHETAARWFQVRRGISRETVEAFGVYTEGRDLVFPYPSGLLKRRYSTDADNPFGLGKEARRFVWRDADGGPTKAGQVPFLPPEFAPRERMLLLEGETDTMAAWQHLPDALREKVGVVGLSGLNAWKARYTDELFADAKRVFVVLDNDDPYKTPEAVSAGEAAWDKIRADLGKKARRVMLPQGINDVAEFFQQYDWAAFEVLLAEAAAPRRHYPRLDWNQPIPDTDWLVEDLVAAGEITLLAGDAGVGKSFLTMALATAVASEEDHFLGCRIKKYGSILYVDEENNPALVVQRMKALGLRPEHYDRIEYLSHAGVNLFDQPELLLEEALDMEPCLIVLDSQSAISLGAEENNNDDMTRMFQRGFRPLARLTGAAVVILHHTPKTGFEPRGAGAIKAQADQVLSAVAAVDNGVQSDRINIFASKARRQTRMVQAVIRGDVEHDGVVRVCSPLPEDEAM